MTKPTERKPETFEFVFDREAENAIDVEKRCVWFVASTEAPIYRVAVYQGNFIECYVILSHEPGAVNLARFHKGANLLWSHDWDDPMGVIEASEVDHSEKKLRVRARFSRNPKPEEKFKDVVDGIITKVSVGCEPFDYDKDGVLVGEHEGLPLFRMNKWAPIELSLVTVPANEDAEVGFSKAEALPKPEVVADGRKPEEAAEEKGVEVVEVKQNNERCKMEEKELMEQKHRDELKGAREAEQARVKEILSLSKTHGATQEMTDKAISDGVNPSDFGMEILKSKTSKPVTELGLSKKEITRYDFMKVVRCLAEGNRLDGIEAEASRVISERIGRVSRGGGVFVPMEIQRRGENFTNSPVQVAGTGQYLVETRHDAASFIDLLYAELSATRLGVTMLPGLTGIVDIPRLVTGHTGYHVAESTAATKSVPVLGKLTLSAKTVSGASVVSRKLLKQSTPAVETILKTDLARAIADKMDTMLTQGLGASNEPQGLERALVAGSISALTCTTVDYAKILAFVTALQTAKSYRPGVKWLTTPTVAAILNAKQKVANMWSPIFDMESQKMIGSDVVVTPNSKASHLFFGLWSEMIMADWGVLELDMVDDTSNADSGDKVIRAWYDYDLGCRRPAGFAWSAAVSA